jgi:hypothetical protein
LVGTALSVTSLTTEGTTQVDAARVAGVGEESNAAVHAVRQAPSELGLGLDDRVQGDLILPDQGLGQVMLVPIRPKREKSLDSYDKKARFSVMISNDLRTSSSYPIAAQVARGRARLFCALKSRWLFFFPSSGSIYLSKDGSIQVSGIGSALVAAIPEA